MTSKTFWCSSLTGPWTKHETTGALAGVDWEGVTVGGGEKLQQIWQGNRVVTSSLQPADPAWSQPLAPVKTDCGRRMDGRGNGRGIWAAFRPAGSNYGGQHLKTEGRTRLGQPTRAGQHGGWISQKVWASGQHGGWVSHRVLARNPAVTVMDILLIVVFHRRPATPRLFGKITVSSFLLLQRRIHGIFETIIADEKAIQE